MGAIAAPRTSITSSAIASSIGIAAPSGVARSTSGGARDEERDGVPGGEDGERVRPHLVRRVAVRGDPVGPDEDHVDLAAGHEEPAATSGISVCGTPDWVSSHAVNRAP